MLIYKVLTLDESAAFDETGEAPLSAADAKDGFVHLSTRAQLPETLTRHFAEERAVRVLAAKADSLGDALAWEPARGGELFPHLHGRLAADRVTAGWFLGRGHHGEFVLPAEMTE